MRTDQKLFCLKCFLVVFLVILWIVLGAVSGVLLWLRLEYWTDEYVEVEKTMDRYLILMYVTMVDADLVLVFSLFGLIGGCRNIKCCLILYLTVLCLAYGLTAAGCVYGFVYREELRNTIEKTDLIKIIVEKRFNTEPMNKITRAVNIMQSQLECCGTLGPKDYGESNWYRADQTGHRGMAPASCCKDYFDYQGEPQICRILGTGGSGEELDENIHSQGCKDALMAFIEKYFFVLVGVVVAIAVLQLICIIVTSILIHVLNNLYVPQPDDIVYDMARNQEKSPYPSRGDYRDYYR